MILATHQHSTRLIDYFCSDIVYLSDSLESVPYEFIFIPSNNINDVDIQNFVNENTTIFIDYVTESGNFFLSCKRNDIFLKKLNVKNIIHISDVIYGDIDSYCKLNNLKIFNSNYFSFYGYLSFTLDSFSLFCNNQFSLLNSFKFTEKRNKIYTSRNGRFNSHRFYTVYNLFKSDLINDGIVTFLMYHDSQKNMFDLDKIDMSFKSNIDKKYFYDNIKDNIPIEIDNFIEDIDEYVSIKGDLHYEFNFGDSYIDLVTENVIDDNKNKFELKTITEKTIKPFLFYQIPIVIAQKNIMESLKNIGFDIFDDLIDLKFDSMESPVDRINLAIEEIKKLKQYNLSEYFLKNKDRFIKNKNLVLKYGFSNGLNDIFNFIDEFNLK